MGALLYGRLRYLMALGIICSVTCYVGYIYVYYILDSAACATVSTALIFTPKSLSRNDFMYISNNILGVDFWLGSKSRNAGLLVTFLNLFLVK